jgi:hypothetical protein
MAEQEKTPRDPQKQDKPKIIVDDDWKAQAQAEKEKLAEEVEKKEGQMPGGPAAGRRPRELPPASFAALVNSIAGQVYMSLGGLVDRKTGRRLVDLDLAKFHIDSLAVLEEKTRGNLTDEEKKLLDQVLYETRIQYVQMAQQSARP